MDLTGSTNGAIYVESLCKVFELTITRQFQRGLTINAYSFITKINRRLSDSNFLLDCFFHTRMTRGTKWKLDANSMMEFIASPLQVQNSAGVTLDHEGDWSKAFVRDVVKYMDGEIEMPKFDAPLKSVPTLMHRDHTIYQNQGKRFEVERRKKDHRARRRLVVDPVMVWSTGECQFFGQQIRNAKLITHEPEAESEDEAEPEDEGVGDDLDPAAQFVRDQLDREADIADGYRADSSEGEPEDE